MGEHNFAALQARLQKTADRGDQGQLLPLTAAALMQTDPIIRLEKLVTALETERVLAAVLVAAEGVDCAGVAAQVNTPQGPATVAFTDLDALRRWSKTARPVPVGGRQQALVAMAQTGGRLVLNPVSQDFSEGGSDDFTGVRLPRPAVQALAHGDSWLPAWRDEELQRQLQECAENAGRGLKAVVSVLADTEPTLKILVEFSVPAAVSGFDVKGELQRLHGELAKLPRLQTAGERVEFIPLLIGG